jgi:hypothetical protein
MFTSAGFGTRDGNASIHFDWVAALYVSRVVSMKRCDAAKTSVNNNRGIKT